MARFRLRSCSTKVRSTGHTGWLQLVLTFCQAIFTKLSCFLQKMICPMFTVTGSYWVVASTARVSHISRFIMVLIRYHALVTCFGRLLCFSVITRAVCNCCFPNWSDCRLHALGPFHTARTARVVHFRGQSI